MIESEPNFAGQTIIVNLGANSYPIYVADDSLSGFGGLFRRHCGSGRAVIVTDDNVGPLYAETVEKSLSEAGVLNYLITVGAGENSKRPAIVEMMYDKLFDFSLDRSDAIVALGGGVIGDLAGFAASTFKRGLSFVQLPTSLLAMVDSSIGGKTGINHPRGKNMIGAFYQPKMVFADTAVLKTLPTRELGCGLAETIKHAVIRDGSFFEYLETNVDRIFGLDNKLMPDLVAHNCRIKAEIVSTDEREAGLRGILNFGHTIGHTLETVLADRDIHHGEAVSLGMVAAAQLAANRLMLKDKEVGKIINLLQKFYLPTSIEEELPVEDLYQAMKQDKKVIAGKIRFVLPTSIGSCTFVDDLTEDEIKEAIQKL